jgi:hypothetical protein
MSLGLLVGRFGAFLEEQPLRPEPPAAAPAPFPADLAPLREVVGHHLLALTLLARADGEFADVERLVILAHCLRQGKKAGIAVTDATRAALAEYLRSYIPARSQLGPALKRLAADSKDDIANLLASAEAVVDADGQTRPAELKLLAELHRDLAAI